MWCALGDSNGDNAIGRLIGTPEYWLNGTVKGVSQQGADVHLLYGVQFDKSDDEDESTWDDHIYNLYAEYMVPLAAN